LLLGAIQGVLLSILLFTKKVNHTANVVLAIGMLTLSIDVFHSAYIIFEYYEEFPHFAGVTYAFPFLYGPIFYLYAGLISSGSSWFNRKYYLHFIPFILVMIYGFLFVYLRSSEFKFALIRNELEESLPGLQILNYLKPVHGLIYVFLTIHVVKVYNNKIRNSYSSIERINLNWLRHLAAGLSIVWGIVVISYVLNAFSKKDIEMDQLIYMAASILIYSIGYLSLRQPQIFDKVIQKTVAAEPAQDLKIREGISYQKSGLTDAEAENHLKNLLNVMETDKPYLKNDLTLRELAEKLSLSTHNLSEILNTHLNQNFYDFINRYRVEEVKRRLADKESEMYSILAIAFDSGFNSKAGFNTIFKKHTGTTPSQYRKQLL
jgi:AraC-like DNA-binding protein